MAREIRTRLCCSVLASVIVPILSSCSSSSDDDDTPRYLLTNAYLGADAALVAGASTEEPTALGFTEATDDPRVEWVLTPLDDGYFRITNRALGEALSLDIINDAGDGGNNDRLRMADTDARTGQFWLVTLLGNGSCQLTTAFLGPERALGSTSDPEMPAMPVMRPTEDISGQLWRLSPLGGDTDPELARCDGDSQS